MLDFFFSWKSNPGIFVYNPHCMITFWYEIFCEVVFHTSIDYLELWLDETNKKNSIQFYYTSTNYQTVHDCVNLLPTCNKLKKVITKLRFFHFFFIYTQGPIMNSNLDHMMDDNLQQNKNKSWLINKDHFY